MYGTRLTNRSEPNCNKIEGYRLVHKLRNTGKKRDIVGFYILQHLSVKDIPIPSNDLDRL